jgi:hypothetical protein
MRVVSSRVRIPVPRITYDPIELMYEESQEIFHLGVYGLSVQPPFNRMLALFLQHNLIFLCGGRDFDGYNIKNDTFYYSITDDAKEGPTELTARIEARPKYSANKFQKVASMISRRYGHMGIYIQKLKGVLVFGGINDKEEIVNSCERYGVLDSKLDIMQMSGKSWVG